MHGLSPPHKSTHPNTHTQTHPHQSTLKSEHTHTWAHTQTYAHLAGFLHCRRRRRNRRLRLLQALVHWPHSATVHVPHPPCITSSSPLQAHPLQPVWTTLRRRRGGSRCAPAAPAAPAPAPAPAPASSSRCSRRAQHPWGWLMSISWRPALSAAGRQARRGCMSAWTCACICVRGHKHAFRKYTCCAHTQRVGTGRACLMHAHPHSHQRSSRGTCQAPSTRMNICIHKVACKLLIRTRPREPTREAKAPWYI